jgi:hypothetical protein
MVTALATVIPLRHRQKNPDGGTTAATTPEPAKLYHLIVLALQLHRPFIGHTAPCAQCQEAWPCSQVCLACRLLDGL